MEAIVIFGIGWRKIAEVIMIRKDKDTRGAIMIETAESWLSTEVPLAWSLTDKSATMPVHRIWEISLSWELKQFLFRKKLYQVKCDPFSTVRYFHRDEYRIH